MLRKQEAARWRAELVHVWLTRLGPTAAKAACNRFRLDAGQLSLRGRRCCADTRAG